LAFICSIRFETGCKAPPKESGVERPAYSGILPATDKQHNLADECDRHHSPIAVMLAARIAFQNIALRTKMDLLGLIKSEVGRFFLGVIRCLYYLSLQSAA
jgi:hypothetical protein